MIFRNWRSLSVGLLLPLSLLFAAGCDASQNDERPSPGTQACTENCEFRIGLPDDHDRAPEPPEVIRVAEGTEVNFTIPREGQEANRTVLSFQQPAFLDEDRNPVYTLELGPGDNKYFTQSFRANVCHPPEGCRYVVINVGRPGRASIISSPHIIIEQR